MAQTLVPSVGTKPTGLLPVPKVRIINARDGNVAQKLAYDVSAFSLNEVRTLMVLLAEQETAQQIRLDNPPAFTNVDNVRGKSILSAKRRITISYGTRLKVQALNDLKRSLMQAIRSSTTARTHTLSNPANWTYRYVRNGRVSPLPLAGASGIPMGPQDFITLMPTGVINQKKHAYATAVNMRVASGGKLSFRRSARSKVKTRDQGIGFLALTARAASNSPAFSGFTVSVGFTRSSNAVRGEVLKGGRTGYLRIRAKTGRSARRG